jgi:hypothetical protein
MGLSHAKKHDGAEIMHKSRGFSSILVGKKNERQNDDVLLNQTLNQIIMFVSLFSTCETLDTDVIVLIIKAQLNRIIY